MHPNAASETRCPLVATDGVRRLSSALVMNNVCLNRVERVHQGKVLWGPRAEGPLSWSRSLGAGPCTEGLGTILVPRGVSRSGAWSRSCGQSEASVHQALGSGGQPSGILATLVLQCQVASVGLPLLLHPQRTTVTLTHPMWQPPHSGLGGPQSVFIGDINE